MDEVVDGNGRCLHQGVRFCQNDHDFGLFCHFFERQVHRDLSFLEISTLKVVSCMSIIFHINPSDFSKHLRFAV